MPMPSDANQPAQRCLRWLAILGLTLLAPAMLLASDPVDYMKAYDNQFLSTRVSISPLLRIMTDASLGDLADQAGLAVEVAVRRRTWGFPVSNLWAEWTLTTGAARSPDGDKQRLHVQTYSGGVASRPFSSPLLPTFLFGVGIVDLRLRDGDASERDWSWFASGEARWICRIDPVWNLHAGVGVMVGPSVEMLDNRYRTTAAFFKLGASYEY